VADTDVLVVGGGITGLTVAYALARRGRRTLVLEAASRAGGLIRTERADGFTIEAGPDALLATKPAGVDLVRELGLDRDLLRVRTPGAFVLRGDRLHRLPSPSRLGLPLTASALAAYDLFDWPARLRLSLEPRVPARRSPSDESVASFFRRRFGPETVDLLAQPLLGGIHAGDIEQLSMQSLFPQLLELERRHGSVLPVFGQQGRSPVESPPGPGPSPFVSLRAGMGSMVEALVRALPDGGVHVDARVDAIAKTSDGWRVMANGEAVTATALVLAAPAHAVARLIAPLDSAAADLCALVPYVSTASVALAWPRRNVGHALDGTGFVVARRHSDVRITAATWVSAKWEARAPDGAVLIRAFLGGSHDPQAVDLDDDELIDVVRRDLRRVMAIDAAPSFARVYRWRHGGAQHTVDHLQRVGEIEARLGGLGGIYVAGAGFRSVGIPDCVNEARRVVEELTGGSGR
jgi:oxygen-dependent protoporphyrinogen oxidase